MENNNKCSSLTNYEKLFSKCYWGNHNASNEDIEIGKNRNLFVEKFKIIKYVNNERATNIHYLFDHCELYKCKEGYVYIASPYKDSESPQIEMFDKMGFSQYHNLYSMNSLTYFKKFSNKVEFNRFVKEVKKFEKL